jgi:hypothetical protein
MRPAVMADQAPKGHVMNGGKNDLRRAARTASFKQEAGLVPSN